MICPHFLLAGGIPGTSNAPGELALDSLLPALLIWWNWSAGLIILGTAMLRPSGSGSRRAGLWAGSPAMCRALPVSLARSAA